METAVIQFIHETNRHELPRDVRSQARRCLLDTLGAGISGRATELSQFVYGFAASAFAGQGAQLWLGLKNDSLAYKLLGNRANSHDISKGGQNEDTCRV